MWSFETDPEFQAQLDWIDTFTREEIEPLDLVFREPGDPWDPKSPAFKAMEPLREPLNMSWSIKLLDLNKKKRLKSTVSQQH